MPDMLTRALDVDDLRARLAGEVVTPADPEWDVARQAWNLAVDQRPALVAMPETDEDVVEIVRYAVAAGLRVAPQGTGHNAHPLGDLSDTVLVKMCRMTGVDVDVERRVGRARAGAVWGDVTEATTGTGLVALHGSSPDVGVIGYSLGGGIGWLARRYGAQTNRVLAIELVTADGEPVRADRRNHPELFWALRGGGGNFGVVTAIEFELFPLEEIYAGWLFFGVERAAEVLDAWREWTHTVPEQVTSIGRILQLPPIPDIPEPLRGRAFVVVEAAMMLDEASGARLLEPLRALGPEMDTFATVPAEALGTLHMDPDHPVPGQGDHLMLSDITAETVAAMAEATVGSALLSVELRHLGGALGRGGDDHGALQAFDGDYAMFAVGMTMTPEMGLAVRAGLDGVVAALQPWDSGREYLNFVEKPQDPRRMFAGETHERLVAVKDAYDPDRVIRANHEL
jgi:UDP-N-acetylenolpyruvoylglucosamine reductase